MLHPEIESLDWEGLTKLQGVRLAELGGRLGRSEEWNDHFARAGMKPADLASSDGLTSAPFLDKDILRD
ncbi:hypothetical protein AB4144_47490, partial [Rhizobiaceae sp. 2RAB30]